jgi:hypothetical protein
MISAAEARDIADANGTRAKQTRKLLEFLERSIKEAANKGLCATSVPVPGESWPILSPMRHWSGNLREVFDTLRELEFKADQIDGMIKVSW